jgi:hypothetical protein
VAELLAAAVQRLQASVDALTAAQGGLVSGRLDVNIGAATATVPVSGPLTDAQLRAAAVPISAAALPLPAGAATAARQDTLDGHLTDGSQRVGGTVAVTGPLTDTQLRASAVPVSGPLTDTQLRASRVPVDGSGVTQPVSGSVSVANLPGTQPVSGTVAVSNLPATQAVSDGGGSLTTDDLTQAAEGVTTRPSASQVAGWDGVQTRGVQVESRDGENRLIIHDPENRRLLEQLLLAMFDVRDLLRERALSC